MRLLNLLLLLFPLISQAQNTLLFELSKKGSKEKSYLFGTLHMQDETAFSFNDSVYWAIDQCTTTAFELDFKDADVSDFRSYFGGLNEETFRINATTYLANEFMPKLMESFTAPELVALISEKIIPAYVEFLNSRLSGNKRTFFIDTYLQNYAYKNNKNVVGIETMEEQIGAILGDIKNIKIEDVGNLVLSSLKDENLNLNILRSLTGSDDMLKMYSQFQLDELCNLITGYEANSNMLTKNLYKRIFFERNQLMYDRTTKLVKNGNVFIAVGAGHLCGDNGLLAQYKNEGYAIRPINLTDKYTKQTEWEPYKGNGYSVDMPKGDEPISRQSIYQTADNLNYSFLSNGAVYFSITYEEMYVDEDEDEDEIAIPYIQEEVYSDAEIEQFLIEPAMEEQAEDMALVEPIIEIPAYQYDEKEVENGDNKEIIYPPLSIGENSESQEIYVEEEYTSSSDGELTPEQLHYLEEVGDSLKSAMQNLNPLRQMDFTKLVEDKDTTSISANGKNLELIYSSSILGSTMSTTITQGKYSYILTVSGDHAALKSDEIHRFFTSFKIED